MSELDELEKLELNLSPDRPQRRTRTHESSRVQFLAFLKSRDRVFHIRLKNAGKNSKRPITLAGKK